MKFNFRFTLGMAAAVAVSAAANAFAFGGLFDSGLYKDVADSSVAGEDSFFAGEAVTFGDMSLANSYASSSVDGLYGDCADCQGAAPVVESGISYEYPAVSYGYADAYGWTAVNPTPVRSVAFAPVRGALRVGHNFLRGVRRLLFRRGYEYCQPAYVCDPCWNVCGACSDSCEWSPCAPCDACQPCAPAACEPCAPACEPCAPVCQPCVPAAVYAPSGCCGNGYAPGQTRPLNSETGKPENGLDTTMKALPPASADNDAADVAPAKVAPAKVATPGLDAPAPADDSLGTPIDTYDENEPEEVPAPAPNTGAGIIKMLVPEDSVVYVNGYRTKQTGAMRTFAAKDLQLGETYSFEIRVVAVRNGRTFEDVQSTTLTAGDSTALAFNLTLRNNEAIAYNK